LKLALQISDATEINIQQMKLLLKICFGGTY